MFGGQVGHTVSQISTRERFGHDDYNANITRNITVDYAQNSFYTLPSYDTNVTQSFKEFNNCIERPPVGLGDDSTFAMTAIYTSSLTWDEMRHNDDFLFPRY